MSQNERGRFGQDFQGTFNQLYVLLLLNFHKAAVPRGYRLETFDPSEHLAFVGRFCVHKPTLFPHSH